MALVFFLSVFFTLSTSCSRNLKNPFKADPAAVQKKTLIGFSVDSLAIERWQREVDVFIGEARSLGADVIVQNAGSDAELQCRQIDYLASKGVASIVILPKEADALSEAVQRVKNRGIPVIAYDRLILNAPLDLFLTVDSETVGYLMGIGMLERTESRRWYRILGPVDDNNTSLLLSGFDRAVRGSLLSIEGTYFTRDWKYDISQKYMESILASGKIPEVVVCGNDAIANSVLNAYRNYAPSRKVRLCGQDADVSACQNIIDGVQDFTIYKPTIHLAEEAARFAVLLSDEEKRAGFRNRMAGGKTVFNGHSDVPSILLEPVLVDAENLEEVVIKSGFHSGAKINRE